MFTIKDKVIGILITHLFASEEVDHVWVQLRVIILAGTLCIYGDVFPILAWYILPPRTIESTTMVKSSIGEYTCQYPFAEIYW